MFDPTRRRRLRLLLAAVLCAPLLATAAPLALDEAERLALSDDPASVRFRALAAARSEAAVAAGQLPDPVLIAELMDVAVDGPTLDDPMTQLRVGLRQSFPRGDSRRLGSAREQALSAAELARAEEAERQLLRMVRAAYLELAYQRQALAVLEQSGRLFQDLLAITEREFAAGRATHQDVLRAELELDRLHDVRLTARGAEAAAQGELARWVGAEAAARPLAQGFPSLRAPTGASLDAHPLLMTEDANVLAGQRDVELARQGYRPQWSVEVTYGRPTGSDPGMDATDRLSGMVMVDLPLFTRNRQDRQVAAGIYRQTAAEEAREAQLRQLQGQLAAAQARWERLNEREQRFAERLLARSAANAEAAEQAYRARTLDFTGLMRARVLELETRLDALRVAADRRLAQADLLYLLGEE